MGNGCTVLGSRLASVRAQLWFWVVADSSVKLQCFFIGMVFSC